MSILRDLVFVYIGPYPLCLYVHFHIKILKIMLEISLQVKNLVLYKKGYGSTSALLRLTLALLRSTPALLRSTHIESFFKIKNVDFYVSIHKDLM